MLGSVLYVSRLLYAGEYWDARNLLQIHLLFAFSLYSAPYMCWFASASFADLIQDEEYFKEICTFKLAQNQMLGTWFISSFTFSGSGLVSVYFSLWNLVFIQFFHVIFF